MPDGPTLFQRRASDCAFVLRQEYSDRLTIDQNIRMEIVGLVAPERLSAAICGDAIVMFSQVVKVRI